MHIVVDIGGTNMRVASAATDALGEIRKVRTPSDPAEGIATLAQLARECARGEAISALVGAIAADTVHEDGTISGATHLRAWESINVIHELARELGAPVRLANDAAVAGLGEFLYGAGKGSHELVYITVSTGVGGGYIKDGKIVGAGGMRAFTVEGQAIEDVISGTAVHKKFGIPPKELDSLEERNKLADLLAEGLRAVQERWPSEVIVLGGSMILGVNPIPIARVQETLAALLPDASKRPITVMAQLGDNGGLWGGLALLRTIS
jgi:glucokinase